MKIAPIATNLNKNTNKPGFGTLYGLDTFNNSVTYFDNDLKQRMRKKVAELEKQYPDIDCYLEQEKEEGPSEYTTGNHSAIMKFVEKTEEPLERPERTFVERLFGEERKGVELPNNLYSAKRSMAWRSVDPYWNTHHSDPEKVFTEMYDEVEKGYKLIAESRKLGEELSERYPNIKKPDLVKTIRKIVCDPKFYEV